MRFFNKLQKYKKSVFKTIVIYIFNLFLQNTKAQLNNIMRFYFVFETDTFKKEVRPIIKVYWLSNKNRFTILN